MTDTDTHQRRRPKNTDDAYNQGYNRLKDDEETEELDEETKKIRMENMRTMVSIMSFAMISLSVYWGAYGQWIYVRFEQMALGANFSKIHISPADDPCFRSNGSGPSPFLPELEEAQANSARFGILNMLCNLIPSFFVNMVLGAYSDRLGRRFIFIITLAGNLVRIGTVVAVAFWELSVYIILIGSVINGFSGDLPALFTGVYVYTADNSTGKGRALAMVVAQTVIGLFSNLASLGLGFYIEAVGYFWPMFTGFMMSICAFVICVFFLRETLDKSKASKNLSLCASIKSVFSFYLEKPQDPRYKRYDYIILGIVFLALGSAIGGGVTTLFLMNEPLCWGSRLQGYVFSISGIVSSIFSTTVLALMKRCLRDEIVCIICFTSMAAQNFVMSFAFMNWHVYLAMGVGIMSSPGFPVLRAILSKMVRLENRGSLFASVAVLEVATVAMSNAGLNELYAATVTEWRGLTFFVVGCIIVFAVLTMVVYTILISARKGSNLSIRADDADIQTDKNSVNSGPGDAPAQDQ